MPEVLMPRLSDSMDEGTIVAWLVEDGARVASGDEIVEIETDKATTTWAADQSGVLRITAGTGDTVPLGATIARIDADDALAGGAPAGDATTAGRRPLAGAVAHAGGTNGATAKAGTTTGRNGAAVAGPRRDDATATGKGAPARDAATAEAPAESPEQASATAPAAKRTGDERPDAPGGPPSPSASAATDDVDVREPSRIERIVAKRMVQSRTEIPEFTVTVEIDMAAALALRAELKAVHNGGTEKRVPSVNDLIVKACAIALREHPRVNSAWTDDRIHRFERVNVGVAVSTDDDGLVVPVVADADTLTLGTLAARTRELTRRARAGKASPADLSGGTFTVSNLGMLGVAHFTAIISPGQGAILAVGSMTQRYVPVDGEPVLRPIMSATLSSDHRVIYGAHAAAFLDRLRTLLEHPGSLAL
jgi:pyruvate dehydrogenase E2 component (dihydrolipoamide acetyltransferase)